MLGENIKKIRKEKKITQSELGKMIGVTGAYIQQLEKGVKVNPSLGVLFKLSFALGIDVDSIITPYEEKRLLWSSDIEEEKDLIIKHYGLDLYQSLKNGLTLSESNAKIENKLYAQLDSLKCFVETVVSEFEEVPEGEIQDFSFIVASWIREYVEMTARAKIQELIKKHTIESNDI